MRDSNLDWPVRTTRIQWARAREGSPLSGPPATFRVWARDRAVQGGLTTPAREHVLCFLECAMQLAILNNHELVRVDVAKEKQQGHHTVATNKRSVDIDALGAQALVVGSRVR